MGLDIFHLKATPAWDGRTDPLYLEPNFPKAFEEYGFGRYVQPISSTRIVYTARFCANAADFEVLKQEASDDRSYWLGTPEAHAEALREIERRRGLDPGTATSSRGQVRRNDRWHDATSITYHASSTTPGLYVVEAGYQRKGMATSSTIATSAPARASTSARRTSPTSLVSCCRNCATNCCRTCARTSSRTTSAAGAFCFCRPERLRVSRHAPREIQRQR